MTAVASLTESAADHHRASKRHYSRASAAAKRAASYYKTAGTVAKHAAWLTGRAELWEPDYTPAGLDADFRAWVRLGDLYIRTSFRETESARFYAKLAARYDAMAARRA
jgi:hypothetical protein